MEWVMRKKRGMVGYKRVSEMAAGIGNLMKLDFSLGNPRCFGTLARGITIGNRRKRCGHAGGGVWE